MTFKNTAFVLCLQRAFQRLPMVLKNPTFSLCSQGCSHELPATFPIPARITPVLLLLLQPASSIPSRGSLSAPPSAENDRARNFTKLLREPSCPLTTITRNPKHHLLNESPSPRGQVHGWGFYFLLSPVFIPFNRPLTCKIHGSKIVTVTYLCANAM